MAKSTSGGLNPLNQWPNTRLRGQPSPHRLRTTQGIYSYINEHADPYNMNTDPDYIKAKELITLRVREHYDLTNLPDEDVAVLIEEEVVSIVDALIEVGRRACCK